MRPLNDFHESRSAQLFFRPKKFEKKKKLRKLFSKTHFTFYSYRHFSSGSQFDLNLFEWQSLEGLGIKVIFNSQLIRTIR
jgi:hypothetical protein